MGGIILLRAERELVRAKVCLPKKVLSLLYFSRAFPSVEMSDGEKIENNAIKVEKLSF